jgi:hypothetical protein
MRQDINTLNVSFICRLLRVGGHRNALNKIHTILCKNKIILYINLNIIITSTSTTSCYTLSLEFSYQT